VRLADLQASMHRLLRGEAGADQVAAELGANPVRLEIYRELVAGHVVDAVDKNFPYLRALIRDGWDRLVADYERAHPPAHWEVNHAAAGFCDFVAAELAGGRAGLDPFHPVLAQFEWEEWLAYSNPAAMPAPAGADRPLLNPTLTVLESPYPLLAFLAEHRDRLSPATPLPAPLPDPCTILVFRHPVSLLAHSALADDRLLLAIKIAAEGMTVADAARATGADPAALAGAVADAAACGVIVASSPP